MIQYLLLLPFMLLAASIYRRYYPVKGVPCIETESDWWNDTNTILDIRDYNEAARDLHSDSVNIPYAYLKRFYTEIPQGKIHVIAANKLELNLGLRFLMRKGFNVASYELKECPCNQKQKKGVLNNGIR
ncbi:sulfurtransferase [Bacillus songklensis]|uniref:Sulfurtransferase n=1 Tax=Bacillus songklensis TaxID=1069116 RepID=A0ABV8B911_9BACI